MSYDIDTQYVFDFFCSLNEHHCASVVGGWLGAGAPGDRDTGPCERPAHRLAHPLPPFSSSPLLPSSFPFSLHLLFKLVLPKYISCLSSCQYSVHLRNIWGRPLSTSSAGLAPMMLVTQGGLAWSPAQSPRPAGGRPGVRACVCPGVASFSLSPCSLATHDQGYRVHWQLGAKDCSSLLHHIRFLWI